MKTKLPPNAVERVYDGFFKLDVYGTPFGNREVLKASDSLNVLVYVEDTDSFVLVKQKRISQISSSNPEGWIIETIAGRFDGDYTPVQLAIKESWEEAGITLHPEQVVILNDSIPVSVACGSTTERAYLAYARITSDQISNDREIFGVPEEGEFIYRMIINAQFMNNCMIQQDARTLALIWYHYLQASK